MIHSTRAAAAASLFLAFVFLGCGGSGDTSSGGGGSSSSVRDADGKTPFDALKAGITAGNEGDYDEASKWLDPGGGMRSNPVIWQKLTKDGTVSKVEFTDEKYQGQNVSVGYQLHYEDGSTVKDHASIVRVDGRWKVEWLSMDLSF